MMTSERMKMRSMHLTIKNHVNPVSDQPLCDFGPYKSVDLTHTQDEKALGWAGFKPPFWTRKVATKGLTVDLGYPDQW